MSSLRSAIMAADASPRPTPSSSGRHYQITIPERTRTAPLPETWTSREISPSKERFVQLHHRWQQPRSCLPGPLWEGEISKITIQHGLAAEGGGLLNSGGQVTLTSVVVANNLAVGVSGANGSGSRQ